MAAAGSNGQDERRIAALETAGTLVAVGVGAAAPVVGDVAIAVVAAFAAEGRPAGVGGLVAAPFGIATK